MSSLCFRYCGRYCQEAIYFFHQDWCAKVTFLIIGRTCGSWQSGSGLYDARSRIRVFLGGPRIWIHNIWVLCSDPRYLAFVSGSENLKTKSHFVSVEPGPHFLSLGSGSSFLGISIYFRVFGSSDSNPQHIPVNYLLTLWQ